MNDNKNRKFLSEPLKMTFKCTIDVNKDALKEIFKEKRPVSEDKFNDPNEKVECVIGDRTFIMTRAQLAQFNHDMQEGLMHAAEDAGIIDCEPPMISMSTRILDGDD